MDRNSNLVAVVTGASRGAGRGIAVALGEAGATVYVTGRTLNPGSAALPGTIGETAQAVTDAGGRGIAVKVDHGNDTEVASLFEQVEREQGRLDILVNNVAHIDDSLIQPQPFWDKPLSQAEILNVGLRSQYVASWYAARIMTMQKRGLIVFTSSYGSVCYMHGAAYGAQKAGVDKLAADMAVDLKDFGVGAVSIWMGMLATERSHAAAEAKPELYAELLEGAETPEFTGRIIAALYNDPALMERSGQTFIGAEIGAEYGISDRGRQPMSYREHMGSPRIPHPAIIR